MSKIPLPVNYYEQLKLLFGNVGYKSPSMLDIASHLAISKQTLYRFVKDKNELVEIIVNKQFEEFYTKSQHIKQEKNCIHQFIRIMQLLSTLHKTFHSKLRYDLQTYFPIAQNTYNVFLQQITEHLLANLRQGIQQKFYREEVEITLSVNYIVKTLQLFEEDKQMIEQYYTQTQFLTIVIQYHLFALAHNNYRNKIEKELQTFYNH